MQTCRYCHFAEVPDDARYCPLCGAKMVATQREMLTPRIIVTTDAEGTYILPLAKKSKDKICLAKGVNHIQLSLHPDFAHGFTFWCNQLYILDVNLKYYRQEQSFKCDGMFSGCENLRQIDLSNLDTTGVEDFSGMFWGCEKLEAIDLSHFNAEKVLNMVCMFLNCKSLRTLNLSNFRPRWLIGVEKMFDGCSELRSINLSGIDFSHVDQKRSWQMFSLCKNLQEVYMIGSNGKSLELIERELYYAGINAQIIMQ